MPSATRDWVRPRRANATSRRSLSSSRCHDRTALGCEWHAREPHIGCAFALQIVQREVCNACFRPGHSEHRAQTLLCIGFAVVAIETGDACDFLAGATSESQALIDLGRNQDFQLGLCLRLGEFDNSFSSATNNAVDNIPFRPSLNITRALQRAIDQSCNCPHHRRPNMREHCVVLRIFDVAASLLFPVASHALTRISLCRGRWRRNQC